MADTSSFAERDFVRKEVARFLEEETHERRVHTRFPPEPNGFLHIGHAKAICLSFEIAQETGGLCNLRFDDTNPEKEELQFIEAIQRDVRWLGFDWEDRLYYTSDYFEKLYDYACRLIAKGYAYVDSRSGNEIRDTRGSPTTPGVNSPYRDRSKEENLELFRRMHDGEFSDGAHCLRAKIDMASPNINLRDPLLYRIRHASHPRSGDKWCIYPLYDFAHGLSDAIEGITHSLCTLEFENHRPLYDWFLEKLDISDPPRQIEFSRLSISHTILSKRKLSELVRKKLVDGWDDPRMPTLAGLRRRGCPPRAIRSFCRDLGVTKTVSTIDTAHFEYAMREELNRSALRYMVVLDPLRLVILNYPEGKSERIECINNPEDVQAGVREVMFSRELYIERDDFRLDPPRKFFRLSPGAMVRLKHAYCVTCEEVEKDETGRVHTVYCRYDEETRGGDSKGKKVKGTLHWVSKDHAKALTLRLYDRLFSVASPDDVEDMTSVLNPDSLSVCEDAVAEEALLSCEVGATVQFLRHGYFCRDPHSENGRPVFNRTVTLRDSWAKIAAKS